VLGELSLIAFPFLLAGLLYILRGRRRAQDLSILLAAFTIAGAWTFLSWSAMRAHGEPIIGLEVLEMGSILATALSNRVGALRRRPWTLFVSVPVLYYVAFFVLMVALINLGALPPPF